MIPEREREALMRLTMCARGECPMCKYEEQCDNWDFRMELATKNMNILADALRKTENSSEKPNNCETCRDKDAYDEWEGNCDECENYSMYTPQTERKRCKLELFDDDGNYIEPQTDYPCNTCANKGDHDGECQNCVADSAPIRWKTPSHYKPKQTEEGKLIVRDYDSKNVLKDLIRALERASHGTCAFIEIRLELREINELLTELYKIPDTNEAEPQTDCP